MVKKNNNNNKVTLKVLNDSLGNLASMVAKGFENTATKDGLKELRTELKGDIDVLTKKVDKLDYQVDEVYDILKRFEENDILNLQKRVQILEKTVRALAANQSSK